MMTALARPQPAVPENTDAALTYFIRYTAALCLEEGGVMNTPYLTITSETVGS